MMNKKKNSYLALSFFYWQSDCEMYTSACISTIKPNPLSAWLTARVCELSGAVTNWFSMSAGPWAPYRLQLFRGTMRNKNSPRSSVCMRSHSGYVRGGLLRGAVLWTRVTTSACRPCPASVRLLNLRRLCALALPLLLVQSEGWQTLASRDQKSATSVCGSAIQSHQLCCAIESCGTGIISKSHNLNIFKWTITIINVAVNFSDSSPIWLSRNLLVCEVLV